MAKPRKTLQRQITEGDPGHKGRRKLREQARPAPKAPFDQNAGGGLSPRAKTIFDAMTVELNKMHLLGAADIPVMTTMANSYADAEEAREEAQRLRATGKKTRDVLQAIAREQKREDRKLQLFLQCSDRLGLSPRSRENLTIEKQDDGMAELMELLAKPRVEREDEIPTQDDPLQIPPKQPNEQEQSPEESRPF
jgi:phage terminase small subunit